MVWEGSRRVTLSYSLSRFPRLVLPAWWVSHVERDTQTTMVSAYARYLSAARRSLCQYSQSGTEPLKRLYVLFPAEFLA